MAMPDGLPAGRDRALLPPGYAGAFRRPEFVALDADDLTANRLDPGDVARIPRRCAPWPASPDTRCDAVSSATPRRRRSRARIVAAGCAGR
jgi:hypothetical protein